MKQQARGPERCHILRAGVAGGDNILARGIQVIDAIDEQRRAVATCSQVYQHLLAHLPEAVEGPSEGYVEQCDHGLCATRIPPWRKGHGAADRAVARHGTESGSRAVGAAKLAERVDGALRHVATHLCRDK